MNIGELVVSFGLVVGRDRAFEIYEDFDYRFLKKYFEVECYDLKKYNEHKVNNFMRYIQAYYNVEVKK